MTRVHALFLAFLAAGCVSRPPETPAPPPIVPIVASTEAPAEDRFHFYRNYFALEEVGEVARHYDVYYTDVEASHAHVVVANGAVAITGGDFGGMSRAPSQIARLPASLADEAARVEAAVILHHPHATRIRVAYGGSYRLVVLSEMIVTTATVMKSPVGWHARVNLRADESLSRIEGFASGWTTAGFGMVEIPPGSARVFYSVPPKEDGAHLYLRALLHAGALPTTGPLAEIVDQGLAVARDVVARKPVPTLETLLSAPYDTALPETYDQPVLLNISVFARHAQFEQQKQHDFVLPIHPRQALTDGKAVASLETDLDGVHIKATATMTPFGAPTATATKQLGQEGDLAEATLNVRVEDSRGNIFDRSYPARGRVITQGPAIAAPFGLALPGASQPSPEANALHATWPGNTLATSFDLYVSAGLDADPR